MYDKAKLAKILAACEKATPGPWEWEPHQEGMDHFTGPWYEPASIRIGDNYFVAFSLDADAQFIALARTALPALARDYGALVDELEAKDRELEELRRIKTIRDKYATSARVIGLYLKDFCDTSLPYSEMIADASRKAADKIERLERIAKQAEVVWAMCVNIGSFSNGVTWGGMDEGDVMANRELDRLKQLLEGGGE